MATLSKRKKITIEVEYSNFADFRRLNQLILSQVKYGVEYDRRSKDGAWYEAKIEYINEPNSRIEIINGQLCEVFKSKM